MRRLRIQNPLLSKNYIAYLASDYASGATITVVNNNSFAANDLGVFGEPREELTELKKISSITGSTTLTLASGLNFAHGKGTPVYKSIWDNVSIEGRSSSAGIFAVITLSALQWDNGDNETIYFHDLGDDNWQYRFRFYNSVTATYSEYSPTLAGTGFTRKQAGYMIDQVRKMVNDGERKIVTDDEIIRMFNEAQDIIYSHNQKFWFLLINAVNSGISIAATASIRTYSLATLTNFGHLDRIRYQYNLSGVTQIYDLVKKPDLEFDALTINQNRAGTDWLQIYKLLPADSSSDNGYFMVDPKPLTTGVGTFYPNYYEKMADLDSVDDLTQVPFPSMLERYAIGRIEQIKGSEQKASVYLSGLTASASVSRYNVDHVPADLQILVKIDKQQKEAVGQARSLARFRGRKYPNNQMGRTVEERDYIRENFM